MVSQTTNFFHLLGRIASATNSFTWHFYDKFKARFVQWMANSTVMGEEISHDHVYDDC